MAPSQHDWKIVYRDVKHQTKPNPNLISDLSLLYSQASLYDRTFPTGYDGIENANCTQSVNVVQE